MEKHDSQLFRYFGTISAKFAILTNGLTYRFFTDLEEPNKMDEKPFLEINMLDIRESHINELKKFKKDMFDVDSIFSSASELKYTTNLKNKINEELLSPSDEFVRTMITDVYDGIKTTRVIDDFRSLVKKSFVQYINEKVNDRLKNALDVQKAKDKKVEREYEELENDSTDTKITTTEEEIQSFYIIKSILAEKIALEKVAYKDTETYFSILYENNTRKWICRIKLGNKVQHITIPDLEGKSSKYIIETLDELYKYRDELVVSVERFI